MHCSRRAREFLHFLHLFCRSPAVRQGIEFTPLLDLLHFMHFLLALRSNARLTEDHRSRPTERSRTG